MIVNTKGEMDAVDITASLEEKVKGLGNGMLHVFLKSTTSALFINEADTALLQDIREQLAKLIPKGGHRHDSTWGDGNGHSHLRSLLLSHDLTLPVRDGRLDLGTWQTVYLLELDVRPRTRQISLTFIPGKPIERIASQPVNRKSEGRVAPQGFQKQSA